MSGYAIEIGSIGSDRLSPSVLSIEYIVDICELDISFIEAIGGEDSAAGIGTSTVRAVNTNTQKVVAQSVVDIIYWMSFRKTSRVDLLNKLCGLSQHEKRKILRGVKRCVKWQSDWNDYHTDPVQQLCNATCPQILLDKRIRHRSMRYIADYTTNDSSGNSNVTAADVFLVLIIQPWLLHFFSFRSYLLETIPSIVYYIRNIRQEFRNMDVAFKSTTAKRDCIAFRQVLWTLNWIDSVPEAELIVAPSFKFTRRKFGSTGTGSSSTSDGKRIQGEAQFQPAEEVVTLGDVPHIQSIILNLIDKTPWVNGNTSSKVDADDDDDHDDDDDDNNNNNNNNNKMSCEEDKNGAKGQSLCEDQSHASEYCQAAAAAHESELLLCQVSNKSFSGDSVLKGLSWNKLQLPLGREMRKRQQIESLLTHCVNLVPMGGIAVEFCSGGGYVGIPLAYVRPDITVLLTDMNSVSLAYAKQRIAALGLTNVRCYRSELSNIESQFTGQVEQSLQNCSENNVVGTSSLNTASSREEENKYPKWSPPPLLNDGSPFDLIRRMHLGITLHACGPATDAVLRICTNVQAAFVVSPCCYGFLQHFVGSSEGCALAGPSSSSSSRSTRQCTCGGECDPSDRTVQVQSFSAAPAVPSSAIDGINEEIETQYESPKQERQERQGVKEEYLDIDDQTPPRGSQNISQQQHQGSDPSSHLYPQSNSFREAGWQAGWFVWLCRQADKTFWSHDARSDVHNAAGQLAMKAIDSDRLQRASELNYTVRGTFMQPMEASVKNHILVGYM